MRVHIPRDWTHQRFSRWLSRASKALLVLSFVSLAIQLGALIAMQVECGKLERPETVRLRYFTFLRVFLRPRHAPSVVLHSVTFLLLLNPRGRLMS